MTIRMPRPVALAVFLAAPLVGATACAGEGSDPARTPVDVSGTEVSLADGTVTTACFTYAMPSIYEYELSPDSNSCLTAIRVAGGDSLTQISIGAQTGDDDVEGFFATMRDTAEQNGLGEVETERLTVDGVPSGVGYVVNSFGVPIAFYFIPLPAGAFNSDGAALTSMYVSGPSAEGEYRDIIEGVVASIEIAE